MALNDMQVRSAKPEEKPYTLGDGLGLSLLIEPTGSKSWRFRYRFGGKPKMISFGAYPLVSLAEARKKRDEARKQVLDGINPSEHRKAQKLNLMSESENTFEIIAREWRAMKSARYSEVFRYAIAAGRAEINPVADLSSVLTTHKAQHYPFLKADEIPAFIQAVESYTGSLLVQVAAKLLMLTGVRTIELRAAEWSEFDLEHAIWEIPAERMKKRRSHLVPLSTQALSLLSQLQTISGNYKYVFPGRNDPNKPMSEGSINRMIKHIGYEGRLTGHGFR